MKKPSKKKTTAKKTTAKKATAKKSTAKTTSKSATPNPASASTSNGTAKTGVINKQPQVKQQAAVAHGMFLQVDDAWSLRYFDQNDLRFKEREVFG